MNTIEYEEITVQVDLDEKIMLDFLTENSNIFVTLSRDAALELAEALKMAVHEFDTK